jgi:hypothetical protein
VGSNLDNLEDTLVCFSEFSVQPVPYYGGMISLHDSSKHWQHKKLDKKREFCFKNTIE